MGLVIFFEQANLRIYIINSCLKSFSNFCFSSFRFRFTYFTNNLCKHAHPNQPSFIICAWCCTQPKAFNRVSGFFYSAKQLKKTIVANNFITFGWDFCSYTSLNFRLQSATRDAQPSAIPRKDFFDSFLIPFLEYSLRLISSKYVYFLYFDLSKKFLFHVF